MDQFLLSPIYLFIHSFIYIWSYEYLFYILGNYLTLLYITQIVPALATGISFIWHLCFFDIPSSMWVSPSLLLSFIFWSFSVFLSFFSRHILYISCPSPRISHLSKEPWFLLLENGIRIQDLDLCILCLWGIISFRPCHLTYQRNVYVS